VLDPLKMTSANFRRRACSLAGLFAEGPLDRVDDVALAGTRFGADDGGDPRRERDHGSCRRKLLKPTSSRALQHAQKKTSDD